MNPCDELIEKWATALPEVCTINDLISAGVVPHRQAMHRYNSKRIGPAFIRLSSRRIIYPRSGIVKWLRERSYAGEKKGKGRATIESFPVPSELARSRGEEDIL